MSSPSAGDHDRDGGPGEDWLRERFCELPFHYVEVHGGGDTYLCCPRFNGFRKIGSFREDSAGSVWNSEQARRIRQGVLDGSFSHCDKTECPRILSRVLPRREDMLHHPYFGTIIRSGGTALADLPDTAKLCHDSSCNLSCPSCRKEMIVADGRAQAELDRVVGDFILPLVSGATLLILSGDGDPFASRHYRAILRSTKESNPDLRIALHTNAVLCDREAWKTCRLEGRVDWADVSVDAARAETYAVVRRGGDFARLGANLEFLGGLRRQGEIKNLRISFVVQALNFREMPAFVAWGKRIGADRVRFSLIREWSRGLNADDFRRAKIWDEAHPRHDAFLDVLRHPLLRDPVVVLGDVVPFFDRANRPRPPLERLRRWLRSRAA